MSEQAVDAARPKLPRPEDILRAADEEILEADKRLADLEAAVAAGDDTVELEHVEAARKQSAWARLRRKGADAKAEKAAQRRREARYDFLVARLAPRIEVDNSARVNELVRTARAALEELVQLDMDRNTALIALAQYAEDESNFRRPEDGLSGHIPRLQGGSLAHGYLEVEWRGEQYYFTSPADIIGNRVLSPLKSRLETAAGNSDPTWLEAL